MSYLKESKRKRRKIEGDTNYISTFGLNYKPKPTRTTELLNKGYRMFIRGDNYEFEKRGEDKIIIPKENKDEI